MKREGAILKYSLHRCSVAWEGNKVTDHEAA